jgi:hypothetical protein
MSNCTTYYQHPRGAALLQTGHHVQLHITLPQDLASMVWCPNKLQTSNIRLRPRRALDTFRAGTDCAIEQPSNGIDPLDSNVAEQWKRNEAHSHWYVPSLRTCTHARVAAKEWTRTYAMDNK